MFGHRIGTLTMLVSLAALGACAYHPFAFPVYGTTDERIRLAGEWIGEFDGARSGVGGSIDFQFDPGRDSATGDVSVFASRTGNEQPVANYHHVLPPRALTGTTLRIRSARVDASIVEGILEPYADAECGCTVTTGFRGEIRGDSIVGHYVSRGGWLTRRGEWRMRRRPGGDRAAVTSRGAISSPVRLEPRR